MEGFSGAVQFYLSEAMRLFDSASVDPDLILAEKLLAWMHAQPENHIYPLKIYRFGPNAIRDAKTAKHIIELLESHGWLTRADSGMNLDGSPRRDVWKVYR